MVARMKSVFLMNIEKLKYIKRFLLHGGNMIEQENAVDKYFYKYPKSNTYSLSENES